MLNQRIASISRIFGFDAIIRNEIWQHVIEAIEEYTVKVAERPVAPLLEPARIRELVSMVDFNEPQEPHDILEFVTGGFWEHQVHTLHPHYFGRFDAAPSTMGVVADALVAAFNPRLSSWCHSPCFYDVVRPVRADLGERCC